LSGGFNTLGKLSRQLCILDQQRQGFVTLCRCEIDRKHHVLWRLCDSLDEE